MDVIELAFFIGLGLGGIAGLLIGVAFSRYFGDFF